MLLITCPVCGLTADETEFRPGGESHVKRPASSSPRKVSDTAQRHYLYERANPRGIAYEMWLCRHGCGKWFNAARDTVTQEFRAFYRIGDRKPSFGRKSGRAR